MTPPNPPTRDRAALTLSRDGHTATVRVGDTVPMTDGGSALVEAILRHGYAPISLVWPGTGVGRLYTAGGVPYFAVDSPAIDIAALAARQSSPAPQREDRAELLPCPSAIIDAEIAEILRKCGEQFRFYEKNHRDKGTQDGDDKAHVNQTFATLCEMALAAWNTRSTAPGDGLAGVVVTEAMQREIAEAWERLQHVVQFDPMKTGRMTNALRAADLLPLPAPKEPTPGHRIGHGEEGIE